MSWAFIWVVLWLADGGPVLSPEPHVVAAPDQSCDDADFKSATYHEAVQRSAHKDQIIYADVWCDEVTPMAAPVAATSRRLPSLRRMW